MRNAASRHMSHHAARAAITNEDQGGARLRTEKGDPGRKAGVQSYRSNEPRLHDNGIARHLYPTPCGSSRR